MTRSIGGWEEGERGERNKRKRQPGRTGAGQRGEWQLNEQREEINIDIEEREENLDVEERQKERVTLEQSGWLGAAAVGSIPALALSLFLQRLQRLNFFSFFNVRC